MASETLASTLLSGSKVDNKLDSLFQKSAGPSTVASTLIPTPIAIPKVEDHDNKPVKRRSTKQQLAALKKKADAATKGFDSKPAKGVKRKAESWDEEEDSDASDTEENATKLSRRENPTKKVLSRPEVKEEKKKAERTIFVGNVPVDCVEKAGQKEFKKVFSKYGRIESFRFRSVAFDSPSNRKSNFIKSKLNKQRQAVNAYVVFKDKESADKALEMDGQVFMEKHLRVDNAASPAQHDRKRSVFLGSLPLDVEEEEVWSFFKDIEGLQSVRVVRDKSTNLGKGIGYAQFKERSSVDLALALDDKDFREGKKIRIQRCSANSSKDDQKIVKKKVGKKGERIVAGPAKVFEGTRAAKSKDGAKKSKGGPKPSGGVKKGRITKPVGKKAGPAKKASGNKKPSSKNQKK